jgi:hypothetical protein
MSETGTNRTSRDVRLLGVKRTLRGRGKIDVNDPLQTWDVQCNRLCGRIAAGVPAD